MLLTQFLAQDLHFAVSLFAALVFFAVFWLIFDAWTVQREFKELLKWLGFLLLSLGFLAYSAVVEQASFGEVAGGDLLESVSRILRVFGYLAIIAGQLIDPMQIVPKTEGLALDAPQEDKTKPMTPVSGALLASGSGKLVWAIGLPLGSLMTAALYWRRSHKGLEHHLQPVAIAFLLFTGFELLALGTLWQDTINPNLYSWVAPFGPLWIGAHALLFAGSLWLARWVWQYLVKRLQSQLFMIFTTLGVAIFALTTVSFTYLLMRNVERETFDNLATSSQVLNYALDAKKAETLANGEAFQNSSLATAITSRDREQITSLLGNGLVDKKLSSLVVTNASGQVLVRAEDPDNWGDSISSDPLLRRALLGNPTAGAVSHEGVLAPTVALRAAVPVRDNSEDIVGTVITERAIDNSFVDGIKQATGLDSTVYSGTVRAATTLVAADGHSRWVGVSETNQAVKQTVIEKGQTYSGSLRILNQPYMAVYAPLKDANNRSIGMLFIGQQRVNLLKTIAESIELTFIVAIALILALIFPAYLIAHRMARQLD